MWTGILVAVIIVVGIYRLVNALKEDNVSNDQTNHQKKSPMTRDMAPIIRSDFSTIEKPNLTLPESIDEDKVKPLIELLTDLFFGKVNQDDVIYKILEEKELLIEIVNDDYEKQKLKKILVGEDVDVNNILIALRSIVDLKSIEQQVINVFDSGKIVFPDAFGIRTIGMRMDGGTKDFICQDLSNKEEFEIRFQRYVFGQVDRNPLSLTAAIYYKDFLVPVRSKFEQTILDRMKKAVGLDKPNGLNDINFSIGVSPQVFLEQKIPQHLILKRSVYEATGFVETEDYVKWAKLLGRID